jgi:hypothetical protein
VPDLRWLAGLYLAKSIFHSTAQAKKWRLVSSGLFVTDRLWTSAPGDDTTRYQSYPPVGDPCVDFLQHKTLRRERIDHAQHPDRQPVSDHVSEIQHPFPVGADQRGPRRYHPHVGLRFRHSPASRDTPHSLVVHVFFSFPLTPAPPIAVVRLLPCQPHQLLP